MAAKTKRIDRAHSVPASPAPSPTRDAIAITALAKAHKADKHRDLLAPGCHNVNLTIYGEIDGEKWQRGLNGVLTIAADSAPVASSATPWEELLKSALCHLSEKERQAWLATLAFGEVPPAGCGEEKQNAVAAELEPALSLYRAAHKAVKRGNVSFTVTGA